MAEAGSGSRRGGKGEDDPLAGIRFAEHFGKLFGSTRNATVMARALLRGDALGAAEVKAGGW
jgi:hypothetical protein